jgi:hypothetical protein
MSDDKVKELKTIKEIRVFSDPYRQEILRTLSFLNRPATAKDVAVSMKESPSKVNYHMGILLKYGFVDLHHTKNINGIIAKYYSKSITTFKVKMESEDIGESEINTVSNMIISAFDNARDDYVRKIEDYIKSHPDKKDEEFDFLNSQKIYMNEEERYEFKSMIEKLSKKDKEGRQVYSLFTSLIKQDIEK